MTVRELLCKTVGPDTRPARMGSFSQFFHDAEEHEVCAYWTENERAIFLVQNQRKHYKAYIIYGGFPLSLVSKFEPCDVENNFKVMDANPWLSVIAIEQLTGEEFPEIKKEIARVSGVYQGYLKKEIFYASNHTSIPNYVMYLDVYITLSGCMKAKIRWENSDLLGTWSISPNRLCLKKNWCPGVYKTEGGGLHSVTSTLPKETINHLHAMLVTEQL